MFDTTLDLFCYNEELNDRQHMVDTMAETLFDAMNECANRGDNFDAVSVFEEWVVDGKDPQDGDVEIIFVPDLTGEREEN
tara:strand:+ start:249 stop:488 length:240 start_codon:yes stop_codon:yes gene_type:complete